MSIPWQVFGALALVALPLTASAAEPVFGVDLGLGAQDVPGATLVTAEPRLTLRLDRTAPISLDAWVGAQQTIFSLEEDDIGVGHAFAGAVGGDGRTCSGTLCVGFRLALGAQYAAYHWGHADLGDAPHATSTTAFLEAAPYLSMGGFSVALEARVHRLLDPQPYEDKLVRFGGGVLFGLQF